MFTELVEKVFGSYSKRELKRIQPIVDKVLSYDEAYQKLSDEDLKAKTPEFIERLKKGETLDDILPEAFAVCREASWRVLGLKHYPVQIIGGIVLHQGRIAEMRTGEGKTLVATLPAYLNALAKKGVHIVTVNDYLARRDSEWMGKVYQFLGLTVGLVVHAIEPSERKEQYACDITYGTNNEFGFDYLRDNMVIYKEQMVQRGHNFAVVDEVDSILVDEARTPLIISGPGDKSTEIYTLADRFVKSLKKKVVVEEDTKEFTDEEDADYIVDEKAKSATLTAQGVKKVERAFGIENLSDPDNLALSHHINQALKANGVMKKDKDYVVKDGEVIIVDEFTGRMMFGRRYSEGLHQAIEAKEGVKVERESKTLATITFQNYFRLYDKLSGMTGTAKTEETEFQEIYKLDVIEIPTNKTVKRVDDQDAIYKNELAKYNAVIDEIVVRHEKGQPVLVGTVSIDKSEVLSAMLKKRGIKHEVLNAKNHDKEAMIVAQAGKKGAVTIATNMAGRGTDIVLGGNSEYLAKSALIKDGYEEEVISQATGFADTSDETILEAREKYQNYLKKYDEELQQDKEDVVNAGGLCILGTERHESRRIDNQLRGRAGRQGDPGFTKFFLSMEDELMRLFGSDKMKSMVDTLGMPDNEPIQAGMLTKAIERAQRNVEGRNYSIRKHVLEYDDVMNQQREIIYKERQRVLDGEDLKDVIIKSIRESVEGTVNEYCGYSEYPDDWNIKGIVNYVNNVYTTEDKPFEITDDDMEVLTKDSLTNIICDLAIEKYESKEQEFGSEAMREIERVVLLRNVDSKWMAHIDDMDQLKNGIGLRAYGQKDPVLEFKYESYDMFNAMTKSISEDTAKMVLNVTMQKPIEREEVAKPTNASHGDDGSEEKKPVRVKNKIGRNDPCPCGSGKKYKKCCGMNED